MSIEPGTRFGNYEAISKLDSGGMGQVYKARDLALKREVAIKILPDETASNPEAIRRFEQEARAASALNHPNIVTIYEVGEHAGRRYIAMEYVEGVTLRRVLAGGALGNDELVRYGVQIAEGLAKAHQLGIVHRDLKPENIIISEDGYVKILDFGLAKLRPLGQVNAEASTLARAGTTPGVILGTLGYMSPEQAKGEAVDFRSDQFSFGAILYEMATGKRAFQRDSPAETLAVIIESEPAPIIESNPKAPRRVIAVVERCLAKDAMDRFGSTSDMTKAIDRDGLTVASRDSDRRRPVVAAGLVGALAVILVMTFGLFVSDIRDWMTGGAEVPSIRSIAVLPLETLSSDPEQAYLSEGMMEALITDLAKVEALRVTSKNSAMRVAASDQSIPEIARRLDADAILTGSVLRADGRVRISVQLVHGETDEHIWAESYDRDLENVLVLISEVAQSIAGEIQIALTPEQKERLASARPVRAELQETYLRARFFTSRLTTESAHKAKELYQETIALDPSFAQAYSGLAAAEFTLGFLGAESVVEAAGRAEAAALQALDLEPNLAEARACLGLVRLYFEWNLESAATELRRALALNPTDTIARHGLADFLLTTRELEASVRQVELARQADPLSPSAVVPVVAHLVYARRYDEAVAEGEAALELFPDYRAVHGFVALARWQQGSYEEAVDAYRKAAGGESELADVIARGLEEHGPTAAMKAAGDLLAERQRSPLLIAAYYASGGENDRALEWLAKAFEARIPQLLHLNSNPRFDGLRPDPRFQELLRRMNFPS